MAGAAAGSAPVAPSDLTATAVSSSQIDLAWTDNSDDEDGFNIYRDDVLIDTVAADATSYSDTGLDPATLYEYYVTAVNGAGESSPSNTDSATTSALLILDEFVEGSNTLLTAHAIAPTNLPGNAYVNLGGSMIVIASTDKAIINSPGVGTVTDVEVADVTITCRVTISNANNNPHGLVFRAQDASNYWFAGYRGNSSQSARITEVNAGVSTIRSETAGIIANGTYTFKVVLSGNNMSFYIDDVLKASHSSAFLAAATLHGFQPSNTTADYDDWTVTTP